MNPHLYGLFFYVLPQIPSCLSFTAHQDLIDGLLGSLRLLQEYFGDAGEEWAYFIKPVHTAVYLRVIIEVNIPPQK